jgi:organic hydroperoxide reductase OsmC/OhrA
MTLDAKEYDFPLSVRWLSGRRTVASVHGKDDLEVATPPEFKGGIEGVWSPEDLFVGSVASCFAVTVVAVAERRGVPLHALETAARGRVTQRQDGRFGFTEVLLAVTASTDPGCEEELASAAEAAERGCLVTASLNLPVHLELEVQTAPLVEATP